jgi:hypothetical protein
MQPIFDVIHPARPTIPSLTATSESAKTDILLNKFEDVAAKLQDVRSREMAVHSRTTDCYFIAQPEKRLDKIMEELESLT